MKLQARLAMTVALAASVAIFVMATAFWVIAADEQRGSVDDQLLTFVSQPRRFADLDARVEQFGRPDRIQGGRGLVELLTQDPGERTLFNLVRIVTPTGQTIVDDGLPAADPPAEPAIETIEIDGERFRMASAALGDDGVVQIARSIEDTEDGLTRLRNRIVLGSLLGIGLAGLLGALVARRLSKPIVEVADAARDLAIRQDLPSRIEVDRTDEVGELADSFNQMLAALETSRDQQRRLVADASHELRTPLTSLRIKIDLLDGTPDLPEEQRQLLLSGAAAELERLTHLVSELVDLASDPTMADEAIVTVQLGTLAETVAERVRRSTGRTITVEADDLVADVRERMLHRGVSNLIDNAIKYSPDEAPVAVKVHGGRIEVTDAGEGIAADDLGLVFDRFYRSPKARTRPGNGIGLAIVQRVAELHGGEVWARNNPDGVGATVGFSVSTAPAE